MMQLHVSSKHVWHLDAEIMRNLPVITGGITDLGMSRAADRIGSNACLGALGRSQKSYSASLNGVELIWVGANMFSILGLGAAHALLFRCTFFLAGGWHASWWV